MTFSSTRGLDSSTALEFIQALRIGTDISRITTVVSLYQAGEQLYNLFDKVCVISEGRMVYFGPAKEARQYFIDMGYEPYHRQTTSDFLVSGTLWCYGPCHNLRFRSHGSKCKKLPCCG
jgi:ATP-binding cassette subfamily G (WHITE) protein 2 (SNQ2)